MACRYRMPSQQHMYQETQAALAVPGEDGCLTVHSGTQSLDSVHQGLTMCLGLPANKVNVGAHNTPSHLRGRKYYGADLRAARGSASMPAALPEPCRSERCVYIAYAIALRPPVLTWDE